MIGRREVCYLILILLLKEDESETLRIIGFMPIWPYIVLQSYRSEKDA